MPKRVRFAATALVALLTLSMVPAAAADDLVTQPNVESVTFMGGFPSPVWIGAQATWRATITNKRTEAISSVAFSGTFPSGMTAATHTSAVCGGTLTTTSSTVELTGGKLAAGASCTVSVTVNTDHAGRYTFGTQRLSYRMGLLLGFGPTLTESLDVLAPPKLTLKLGASPIAKGASTTLEIKLEDPAPNHLGLPNVGYAVFLQNGITANVGTQTACGGTLTRQAHAVSLILAYVQPTTSCSVVVTVNGDTTGTFSIKTAGPYSTLSTGKTGAGAGSAVNLVVAPPLPAPVVATPTPIASANHSQPAPPTESATPTATGAAQAPDATPAVSPADSPGVAASATPTGVPVATGAAGSSAPPNEALAGETMTASGSPGAGRDDAPAPSSGGDSTPWLLFVGLLVVAIGGGIAALIARRRMLARRAAS